MEELELKYTMFCIAPFSFFSGILGLNLASIF